jgi:glycosyltransferase involved in cell wall biosynthesis
MNITFISTGSYPDMYAGAIRHSLLARGLAEQGHQVQFLLLSPQDWKGQTTLDYHGVQFKELNGYRGSGKLLQHYHYLRGLLKVRRMLRDQQRMGTIDVFFVHVVMPVHVIPVNWLVGQARKMGIPVFHERTELPYVFGYNEKMLDIYTRKMLPKFDGLFVISDKLITWFSQYNNWVKKLVTVVDMPFFQTSQPSPYSFPYVGYCGTIGGTKDGVPILIQAFAKIKNEFPELRLVLVGNNANKEAIRDTIEAMETCGIGNEVVFTGLVEREMMPVILGNAEILVVAKPNTEQNSGNFPIKIGEYLATGVPVVVTDVGEISLFIKDGENGYLSAPDDPDAFAGKMREALTDREKARTAGRRGQHLAAAHFDYRKVAERMATLMQERLMELKTTNTKQTSRP